MTETSGKTSLSPFKIFWNYLTCFLLWVHRDTYASSYGWWGTPIGAESFFKGGFV